MDPSHPVQQWAAVLGALERLNEEKEAKPAEQLAEEGCCHDHEGRHHHKPQNDEGGAAVVVKVMADGRGGIEDLQKQSDKHRGGHAPEAVTTSLASAAYFLSKKGEN